MTISTATDLLTSAAAALRAADIDEPRREARLLLGLASGLDATALLGRPDPPIAADVADAFAALLARRIAGTPSSRLAGEREFWSLRFRLGPDTLDPRPDSEAVVAAALDCLPRRDAPYRLLDLGTGTGCLLLALLSERPAAFGIGTDRSPGAAAVARGNAAALGMGDRAAFAVADWTSALVGPFDLIISNPPYIETAAIAGLEIEVHDHDPHAALDGGTDGLDPYRIIAADAARLLVPGGTLALEFGFGQAPAVVKLLESAGFGTVVIGRDLAGIERCVTAKKTFA